MTGMPRVAFICVHNSCRSQIAEALGRALASDAFESFSAGSEPAEQINPDAVRIMRERYGIDMSAGQRPKTVADIPAPDIAISMGCGVSCPFVGRPFDEDWGLADPTGGADEEFLAVIEVIRERVLQLRERLMAEKGVCAAAKTPAGPHSTN